MSTDRENQAGANTAGQSELIEPLESAQLTWKTAGITTLEQFVMKANDWLFCIVAADINTNMVRLNCEAVCQGTVYWVGTLEQLFAEFDRL